MTFRLGLTGSIGAGTQIAGARRSGLCTPSRGEPKLDGHGASSPSSPLPAMRPPPTVIASAAAPGAGGTCPAVFPAAANTVTPAATTSATARSTSSRSGSSGNTPSDTLRIRIPSCGYRSGSRIACATCLPRTRPPSMPALISTTSASLASPR